jgi:hypothetical protein
MKNIENIMNEAKQTTDTQITALIASSGAFYAFGQAQYEAQKTEGVEYVQIGCGLIIPKDQAQTFSDQRNEIFKAHYEAIKQRASKEDIIFNELMNYECFYNCDSYDDAVNSCAFYGYTKADVDQVYKERYAETVERMC